MRARRSDVLVGVWRLKEVVHMIADRAVVGDFPMNGVVAGACGLHMFQDLKDK